MLLGEILRTWNGQFSLSLQESGILCDELVRLFLVSTTCLEHYSVPHTGTSLTEIPGMIAMR